MASYLNFEKSKANFLKASNIIPGASQTFSKSHLQFPVGYAPQFAAKAEGAKIWDVDGNQYIDLVAGLLPIVLGYRDYDVNEAIKEQLNDGIVFSLASTLEEKLATLLCETIPCAEMVRFGKNGSDATSCAIRLARGYNGKTKVVAIGYHGWHDWYVGSTSRNLGVPDSIGKLTLRCRYNDLEILEKLLKENYGDVSAVIMEPVSSELPKKGYLEGVRRLCDEQGVILIFDEVITGFRAAIGGAQELYGVIPDLACFGKAMGNGMPISACVGRKEVMSVAEEAFISSTFGGECLSLAAAIATITKLKKCNVIAGLWDKGKTVKRSILDGIRINQLQDIITIDGIDPWTILKFNDGYNHEASEFKTFVSLSMISKGVLLQSSNNIMAALSADDVDSVCKAYTETFIDLKENLRSKCLTKKFGHLNLKPIFSVR